MPEIPAVTAKIGADVSDILNAYVRLAGSTRELGDVTKMTREDVLKFIATQSEEAAMILRLTTAEEQAAETTKKWTEAQQRAEMSMSGAHDQALKMNEAFDEAQNTGGQLGASLLNMVGAGALAAGGFAAATAALSALKSATVDAAAEFVSFGHSLEIMHEKVNVPLEVAAAWKETERVTNMSAESIVNTLAMMDTRLEQGNKQAIQAVNTLGISLKDLRDATPDQQVQMLSEAFAHVGESGEKADAVIKELMGRGGLGMLPVLTPEAQHMREEIEKINGPLEEQVKTAERYNSEAALLEAHWAAIKRVLTEPIVGGLAGFLEAVRTNGTLQTLIPMLASAATGMPVLPPIPVPPNTGGATGSWTSYGFGPGQVPVDTYTVTATQAEIERADAQAKAEQAKYARELAEAEKELEVASSGAMTAYEKEIATISANTSEKVAAIEADTTLTEEHKQALIDEQMDVEAAQLTQATMNEERRQDAEAIREQNAAVRTHVEEYKKATDQSLIEVERTLAGQREARAVEIDVDSAVAKAQQDLATAHHQSADAVDYETQRVLDHIEKLRQHIIEDKNLTPEEKQLALAKIDVAEATEREAGEQKKANAEWKQAAKDIAGIKSDFDTLTSTLKEMGLAGGEAFDRISHGISQVLGGAQDIAAGMASGNVFEVIKGGIESIGGLFNAFHTPEYEKVMTDVGHSWGISISKGIAEAIASTEAKDHVNRQMAELLNLDKIMKEAGGDPARFEREIEDLMNAVKLGAVPAAEGVTELGKAFGDLQQAVAAGSVQAEAAMIKMIQRARELGEVIPEVQKAVLSMLQSGAGGLADFFSGQANTAGMAGGLASGHPTEWSGSLAGANATILGANFQALAAQEGVVKAAQDLQKAFDELMKHVPPDLKLPDELAHMAVIEQLLKDARFADAAQASQAGAQNLHALLDTGYLNQQTLDAFSTVNTELMKQSIQAAVDNGYSPDEARIAGEEANLPMLTEMQHAEELGMKLSPEAKAMLEQAQKDGILPVATLAEQQLNVLREIRDRIGGLTKNTSGSGGNEGEQTFAEGGPVASTGFALVHAGEYVIPRSGTAPGTAELHSEMRALRNDLRAMFAAMPDQWRDAALLRP